MNLQGFSRVARGNPIYFHSFATFFQVVRTLEAACFANISLSNLSVNGCDDRRPLYSGSTQCGCSVQEEKLLRTQRLSHPMLGLGGAPGNFPLIQVYRMQCVLNY